MVIAAGGIADGRGLAAALSLVISFPVISGIRAYYSWRKDMVLQEFGLVHVSSLQ